MEEPAVESLENNQHSDSEYEKVQYPPPGEEDSSGAVKDVDTRETPATTPPNLGRAVERPGKEGKTTKSQLESSSNARVESKETGWMGIFVLWRICLTAGTFQHAIIMCSFRFPVYPPPCSG